MMTNNLPEHIEINSYQHSQQLLDICHQGFHRIVIIGDSNVMALYHDKLQSHLASHQINTLSITFQAGEEHKTRATKSDIEDQLFEMGCNRDTLLIALGGGVTTDLVGFVASTFNRGVPVIYIPTSLMAIIDASIGGKTGLNTPHGKNLIGTFTEPQHVLIDTNFLTTLSSDDYHFALSEVVKHALIADPIYFEYLESHTDGILSRDKNVLKHIILRSLEIKSLIVKQDPQEKNIRAHLNFGHTYAHAIEKLSAYNIPHGKAVALGIKAEVNQSSSLSKSDKDRVLSLLKSLSISFDLPFDDLEIKQSMNADKKCVKGQVRFINLKALGHADGSYTA